MADEETETTVTIPLGRVQPIGKKEYESSTAYTVLDIVTYQGSSYMCIKDCTGYAPTNTDYWQVMAEKGDTGNGISKIEKTKTEGSIDSYTIYYTDGTKDEFTIENGTMTFIDKIYYNDEGELIVVTNDEVDVEVNDEGELVIDY